MSVIDFNNNKFQFKKKHKFSPAVSFLIDLFFPKHCLICGKEKTFLCQDCFSLIEINSFRYCLCQKPQRAAIQGKCPSCRNRALTGLYFACIFGQKALKKAVHSFKYPPYLKDLAWPLAYLIILHFEILGRKIDPSSVLIPVPLFLSKEKERGFNQSKEIADILAKAWQIKIISGCLTKIKKTANQAEMGKEQRSKNLEGAFRFTDKMKKKIKGKKIYLIDDVYTTGATMEECAKILKQSGAREVWGIAVAREIMI
ncbi:MAG: phosphoribosyltransferase family protein [Candidatus Pacebacteria bacterium]|nr:phosphoribosyltransferase family protein [Candidatus Paceibacterota bacterium]